MVEYHRAIAADVEYVNVDGIINLVKISLDNRC
jgi:hypothetical protein